LEKEQLDAIQWQGGSGGALAGAAHFVERQNRQSSFGLQI